MSFKIKSQAEQNRERIEKNFSQGLELQKGKALPIGTINKWGEQKMADGSWKYVGKQAVIATKAKEEKQNTSSLLTSSEGEVSIEGEKHTYRVYKDGEVKVEGFNMRKDFKSKAEAEKYLSGVGAKKYKHPSVGKMMELKGDVNLVSTMDLKGKTLEIVDTRDVQFASGAKTYYIYEEGGKRKEISEDLVTVKGVEKKEQSQGKEYGVSNKTSKDGTVMRPDPSGGFYRADAKTGKRVDDNK